MSIEHAWLIVLAFIGGGVVVRLWDAIRELVREQKRIVTETGRLREKREDDRYWKLYHQIDALEKHCGIGRDEKSVTHHSDGER